MRKNFVYDEREITMLSKVIHEAHWDAANPNENNKFARKADYETHRVFYRQLAKKLVRRLESLRS